MTRMKRLALLIFSAFSAWSVAAQTPKWPVIFPIPQELRLSESAFRLDDQVVLLLPTRAPSDGDLFIGRLLAAELSDLFGFALRTEHADALPANRRAIVIGSQSNPLVAGLCAQRSIRPPTGEGYALQADSKLVLVAGGDDRGTFYGFQSLRQLIEQRPEGLYIRGAVINDWPYKAFRGAKLFLPGRDNFPFFKRLVRDFLAFHKFNKLIIEVNAGMRFERHPELNAGWLEFGRALSYSRRDRPWGPGMQFQDSAHHDTADGAILEQEEVADLVRWAKRHHMEVIPEIPSLSHSYYLLTRHRELAEIPQAEWPDTYCPSNPKSYELLFDVLEEYLAVMQPSMVHIGHDEWRMPVDVCPRCKGKDPRDLFIQDVNRIHAWLREKGVETAIWGDHLLEDLRGQKLEKVVTRTGYEFHRPGGLSPEQVKGRIPKDILIFNWFWRDGGPGRGEHQDRKLQEWGFRQVYGNFKPDIQNYGRRSALPGVMGGAPSVWAALTEFEFGKDEVYEFAGTANLLWSRQWPDSLSLADIVQNRMARFRRALSGVSLPSEEGETVAAVDLPSQRDTPFAQHGLDFRSLLTGALTAGRKVFRLDGKGVMSPSENSSIRIGEDASSIIFLHASARPAGNVDVDMYVYNAPDTADLLGWYEVVYEDGLVHTIPIRYGVNVLAWNWRQDATSQRYCYRCDPVIVGEEAGMPVTFFAFEWVNPRFSKAIREIRLKSSSGFKDTRGRVIDENPVWLRAISVVKPRVVEPPAAPPATQKH